MDRYAVFGNPIAHSKSPQIHRWFAEQTQQCIEYQAILAPENQFVPTVTSFFEQGGKGANVTVPFKQDAYRWVQQLSQRAQLAGAVNTLILEQDGHIRGDNTDGIGLINDLTVNLGWSLRHKTVLLIGAGGAARGVIAPLLAQSIARLVIVNRTVSKSLQLAQSFQSSNKLEGCGFSALKGRNFDIVINASSTSLSGELPPLPDGVLSSAVCCYDMMYSTDLTPFLVQAKQQSTAAIADGLGMLVEQAAASFFLWRGVKPQTAPVIQRLREQLRNS